MYKKCHPKIGAPTQSIPVESVVLTPDITQLTRGRCSAESCGPCQEREEGVLISVTTLQRHVRLRICGSTLSALRTRVSSQVSMSFVWHLEIQRIKRDTNKGFFPRTRQSDCIAVTHLQSLAVLGKIKYRVTSRNLRFYS